MPPHGALSPPPDKFRGTATAAEVAAAVARAAGRAGGSATRRPWPTVARARSKCSAAPCG